MLVHTCQNLLEAGNKNKQMNLKPFNKNGKSQKPNFFNTRPKIIFKLKKSKQKHSIKLSKEDKILKKTNKMTDLSV